MLTLLRTTHAGCVNFAPLSSQEEKQQAVAAVNAELAALRLEAAASAAAAEARGKRLGAIEKEVAEAQIKAQQASLAEEKEVRAVITAFQFLCGARPAADCTDFVRRRAFLFKVGYTKDWRVPLCSLTWWGSHTQHPAPSRPTPQAVERRHKC